MDKEKVPDSGMFPTDIKLRHICEELLDEPWISLDEPWISIDELTRDLTLRGLHICSEDLKRIRGVVETTRSILETRGHSAYALSLRRWQHWGILAGLAGELGQSVAPLWPMEVVPRSPHAVNIPNISALWLLDGPENIRPEADGLQAVYYLQHPETTASLEEVRHYAVPQEVDYRFYPDLMVHMKAEDPQWNTKMCTLKDRVHQLYNLVRSLELKIVEEAEKRTDLPYDPAFNYGLFPPYGRKVLRMAISNYTPDYNAGGLILSDGRPSAGAATHNRLVKVSLRDKSKLQTAETVHRSLGEEVKQWREYEDVLKAYELTEGALAALKEELVQVSKRGVFTRGRCPSCP